MKVLSIFILCFTLYTAKCQVQKANDLEEVFRKEFSTHEETNLDLSIITPPEVLPNWFFLLPQGNQDVLYSIGISDPWIDKERGNQQAKYRALCIASLMNNVTTKGISDVFNRNDQSYKFEQITYFNSLPTVELEGTPIDSAVTKYLERIFLFKFTKGKTTHKINSSIEYYKSAIKQDAGYSKQEKLDFIGKSDDFILNYKYAVSNNDFEIVSVFNSDTLTIKPVIYQYTGRIYDKNVNSVEEISLFKKGLWQGFFKSMIDNLDIAASEITPKQKSVSDFTQNENGVVKINQLNRGVYNTSFSFSIASIQLTHDDMIIQLKTNNNQFQGDNP